MRICWGPPHGSSAELIGHIVTVTEGSSGQEVARESVGASTECVVLFGLDPDKVDEYQYGVSAVYQGGVESEVSVGSFEGK